MSTNLRKVAPTYVLQFTEYGGVKYNMLRFPLFLLLFLASLGSYFISKSYPALFRAFWYGGMASLNTFSFAEMLLNLPFTAAGISFIFSVGGCCFYSHK